MNKRQFLLLSWTWGFILTFLGFLGSLFMKLLNVKTYKKSYATVYELPGQWGGFTLGPYIFICENPGESLLNHEFGHSLQNCYWGPNTVLITLMSIIRYWYREIITPKTKYDDIWFEGSATYFGTQYKERGLE